MIRVEPAADNRALVVAAVDEEGTTVRQSLEQLDGDAAPRTRWLTWARLPGSEYTIVATVYGASGHVVASARVTMMIVARR